MPDTWTRAPDALELSVTVCPDGILTTSLPFGIRPKSQFAASALAYTLEARRLGIGFLSPDINRSAVGYTVEYLPSPHIRVPLATVKGLHYAMLGRAVAERERALFESLADFYRRVQSSHDAMLSLIRVGAFDSFGDPRTKQFWQLQYLAQWATTQGFLFSNEERARLPDVPLTEPNRGERLADELELLGFTITGHPLDAHPHIAWGTYCPVRDLMQYAGQTVIVAGLIIAERSHHQATGDQMRFITVCDYTGIIECEIFASAFRRFGLATLQHPIVEIEATVTPFDSGLGCTLNVQRVGKPRSTDRRSTPDES